MFETFALGRSWTESLQRVPRPEKKSHEPGNRRSTGPSSFEYASQKRHFFIMSNQEAVEHRLAPRYRIALFTRKCKHTCSKRCYNCLELYIFGGIISGLHSSPTRTSWRLLRGPKFFDMDTDYIIFMIYVLTSYGKNGRWILECYTISGEKIIIFEGSDDQFSLTFSDSVTDRLQRCPFWCRLARRS